MDDFEFDDIVARAADETRSLPVGPAVEGAPQRRRHARRTTRAVAGAATLTTGALIVAAVVTGGGGTSRGSVKVVPATMPGETVVPAPTTAPAAPTAPTVAPSSTTSRAPTTTTSRTRATVPPPVPYSQPEASQLPALLVAHQQGDLVRVTPSGSARLDAPPDGPPDAAVAFALPDGSVVVQGGEPPRAQIARWRADGTHVDYPQVDGMRLLGVGSRAGRDVFVVVPATSPSSDLLIVDADSGQLRSGGAARTTARALRASIVGDRLLVDAADDTGAWLELRSLADPNGTPVVIRAPAGDLGTRRYSSGVLSPDGSRMAFLDSPPYDAAADVVVRRTVGEPPELVRVTLPVGSRPALLDYDGRYVVVSMPFGWPTLVLDTTEATPTWRQLTAVTGTVTIDRF